jgi:hypothetical protein
MWKQADHVEAQQISRKHKLMLQVVQLW